MAINPNLVSIIPASELPTGVPTPAGQFFFYEGNEMKKSPMTEIYELVSGTQSIGTITPSSTIPADGNIWGFAGEGTYPNAGNITVAVGKLAILSRVGTTWSKVEMDVPKGADGKTIEDWSAKIYVYGSSVYYNSKIWKNNVDTLSTDVPGVSAKWEEVYSSNKAISEVVSDDNLYYIVDKLGAIIGTVSADGKFDINLSDSRKTEILTTFGLKKDDNQEILYAVTDVDGAVLIYVDKTGKIYGNFQGFTSENTNYNTLIANEFPYIKDETKNFVITNNVEILSKIKLNSTAYGREVSGVRPTITINGDGFTHPQIIYVPNGWNGYKYLLAATPYFGVVATDSQYENPHLFGTNDDTLENWTQLNNGFPIDYPETENSSYWSDNYIELGDDGYLYCFYKGNFFSPTFLNETTGTHARVVVYRRSRDGVNWSPRKVIYSSDMSGTNQDSQLVSPCVVKINSTYNNFIIGNTSVANPLISQNMTTRFLARVSQRSIDERILGLSTDNLVNFINRPFGTSKEIWHGEVKKYGNLFIGIFCVGTNNNSYGSEIWLATSFDGWNFKFCSTLISSNAYKSTFIIRDYKEGVITIDILLAGISAPNSGVISVNRITLKYL